MKQFIALIVTVLMLVSCGESSDKGFDENNYQTAKESLADKERKSPVTFLEVGGNDKRNWLGQTVVKGTIHNKATIVSYRDIRVKMLFYNKDGKLVTNHEDVYTETIAPGGSMKFKARYGTPRGTDSVALSIMSAAAVAE
ncbi:FxLYD domain-containing protein [Foetidibacter luteolus]|uniref:FxLYD domain-containing protein n=1 Tax=Foetidibacter luteolus TaxID=2608880 RepID=UPI00129A2097|nr:FxLYD domain-containing protein [Foetidibacter luteolus]